MNPPLLEMVVGAACIWASGATIAALRMRAQVRAARLALRLSDEREGVFVERARRLADAASVSIGAVREEMDRAIRSLAQSIETVLFFEESDAELRCVAASGARAEYFTGMRSSLDDDRSLLVCALRCGHRVTSRERTQTRPLHPADRTSAAIPLVIEAGRRCVVYVGAADDKLLDAIDRIVRLVDQATPAYRIALDRADDRARAQYDGLTGLLTARAFRSRLAEAVEAAASVPAGRVGLLFLDTDHFKTWNDTYGHASGDALLRELAGLLRSAASDSGDLVARNGGDEFCLVFAEAQKSRAIERAIDLCSRIAAVDFDALRPAAIGAAVRISASIGVACFPADAHTASDLLERADAAMYHSKRTGRNAVAYYAVDGTLVRAGDTPPDPDVGQ